MLPFLLEAGGAPTGLTGLLVPVRESGSLLPQAMLTPMVQRVAQRKRAWSAGSVGQALAIGLMALVAAFADGLALGIGIIGALALFALARSLSSIAFKDAMGRSISTGSRGNVTGRATSAAGAVALTLGIGLRLLGDRSGSGVFVVLLVAAAMAWLLAAGLFLRLDERQPEDDGEDVPSPRPLKLLRQDATFRHFVGARTLLLASALGPPYVVALAVEQTGSSFGALGPFVVASGIAALMGGRLWGDRADDSSRRVMAQAAGLAAVLLAAFLVTQAVEVAVESIWLYVATHFLLNVVHAGARVGRSTYVVDFAEGDLRTVYVGASNTAMGVLLLVVGGIVGAVATASTFAALVVLVGVGLAGVPASLSLPRTANETG